MSDDLHPQLLADCHLLGRFDQCVVLLHRNAVLPWFILVPKTAYQDLLDLPAAQLATVMDECQSVGRFIKQELGLPKLNTAALGNVVPQLHIHVIGRRAGDACWPAPVWGNLKETADYSPQTLDNWCGLLQAGSAFTPAQGVD